MTVRHTQHAAQAVCCGCHPNTRAAARPCWPPYCCRHYRLQATVLKQLGLLPDLPCVSGAEQARKAADHGAEPSNKLINSSSN